MLSQALQMAKPAMQQLEGEDKSYNGASHYLPCVFDIVQCQQVKGWVPHHSLESECYKKECSKIMLALQGYTHTRNTMHGHPSPISLDRLCNLVLPSEDDDNNDDMMPATAPGCNAVTLRMQKFAAASMEQDAEMNWDSESDKVAPKLQPVGMSDQEDWDDEDQINMGDQLAVADEPPIIEYGHIEGAVSGANVPTISTHSPDPTHSSMQIVLLSLTRKWEQQILIRTQTQRKLRRLTLSWKKSTMSKRTRQRKT